MDLKTITSKELSKVLTENFPYLSFKEEENIDNTMYLYEEKKSHQTKKLYVILRTVCCNTKVPYQFVSVRFEGHNYGSATPIDNVSELLQCLEKHIDDYFDIDKTHQIDIFHFLDQDDLEL